MNGLPHLALLVACLVACSRARPVPAPPPADPPVPTGFDHVIVAIDTIERGIALLRAATGVEPRLVEREPGDDGPRRHLARGFGTQSALLQGNSALRSALLDLGEGRYLELVGLDQRDPDAARLNQIYSHFHEPTVLAWALHTPDAAALRDELRSRGIRSGALREGERQLASGGALRWRTFTPWELVNTMYPVFIEWTAPRAHPSDGAVHSMKTGYIEWTAPSAHPSDGAPTGCSLTAFTLGAPDAAALRAPLDRAGVRATVLPMARPEMILTMGCPTGRVELPLARPGAVGSRSRS